MNLDQIETKCFILALFIRDDDERFLLGSRAYEFVDSQLHFAANSYQNDIVEVQGNDGVMLAGQVRRGTSQAFDGYIGDQTVDRASIEQYRRDFMKFFRKNHYYKVVYVFPDGSAVQRRNGFIVEAPEVKELYQLFPKYHISMNFEDINYYLYEEDADGQEIYGESATLKIATAATGGLIWEELSQTTLTGEGTNFSLDGTVNGNPISNVQLNGDTTQQTYSGKNLYNYEDTTNVSTGVSADKNGWITITYDNTSGSGSVYKNYWTSTISKLTTSTQYDIFLEVKTVSGNAQLDLVNNSASSQFSNNIIRAFSVLSNNTVYKYSDITKSNMGSSTTALRTFCTFAPGTSGSITFRITVAEHSDESATDFVFEPYVGGIPAPNPSYPQTVSTVTGRQVVTISDSDSQSQEYEVNLGKNLIPFISQNFTINDVTFSIVNGSLKLNGTSNGIIYSNNANFKTGFSFTLPAGVYTFSGDDLVGSSIREYDSGSTISAVEAGGNPSSFTLSEQTKVYLGIYIANNTAFSDHIAQFQLEKGSATTYAPYFEPIELCKIGTYQDYIYKSGSDWYVHKAIGKVQFDGTEAWQFSNSYHRAALGKTDMSILFLSYSTIISNYFITGNTETTDGTCTVGRSSLQIRCYYDTFTSLSDYTTWFSTYKPIIYGALETPTDTQITNTDLIAQLNALAGATTYDGTTVFTVTSPNQLAILSLSTIGVGGGGVMWDDNGAVWEEGTGGGPTMIDVDSIDNVYPVWTVTGPAVNPQISVLTTNTTLSYSGTVTASQELKIDMFNKTATLNGASVVGNVSGDWVYLKPGVNRITYTTNNADAPYSTIWWQEIVG